MPVDLNSPDYRLTSRVGHFAARRLIPRADWQFGRVVDGRHVADPDYVTLKGGFQPGITYELAYESQNPPVVGLGLAAVRDMASAMKYDPAIVSPGRYAYMYGSSQTGRTLRTLIHGGFTIDERERKVFDAAFIKTGGGSIGRFNERFALVNSLGVFTETQFPFQYQVTTDPVTGKRDGLGLRIPAGLEPKIFTFDSGSEYWDKGRLGGLRHASIDGTEDSSDAPNVRMYYIAGSRHGSGTVPATDGGGQLKNNTLDYDWAAARLDGGARCVGARRQGAAAQPAPEILGRHDGPAPSAQIPRSPRREVADQRPGRLSMGCRGRCRVRLAVPSVPGGRRRQRNRWSSPAGAGRARWRPRPAGSSGVRASARPTRSSSTAGGYIPFPATRAEREKTGDPRLSIAERYTSRADYLTKITAVANRLAEERYVLKGDVQAIIDAAGKHWDWRMGEHSPRPLAIEA